jgi:F-type H+-transporting ATPase subunit delta
MNEQELAKRARHASVLDDEGRRVGKVYASALYQAAEKSNQVEQVLQELNTLVQGVFRKHPGLALFLASAAVGRDRKTHALRQAFEHRASPVFLNFLLVLNDHDRLNSLPAVADAFQKLHDRRGGLYHAEVRSAIPLNEEERRRLLADIHAVTGQQPVLKETIDPQLLGGLIVRGGDWVYDASLRTRLGTIRNQLIERSSHGIQGGRDRFGS